MLWQYWSEEWLLYEKVSFNGDTRSIFVHPDVTHLDIREDIWSAWVRWRARGNDHFHEAMRRTGFDALPDGNKTGDSYFLINNWKLYIELEQVKGTGVLFSDDFETAFYDTQTGNAVFPFTVSSKVNTVVVEGGTTDINVPTVQEIRQEIDDNSIKLNQIKNKTDLIVIPPTTAEIAAQVWNYGTRTLTQNVGIDTNELISLMREEMINVQFGGLEITSNQLIIKDKSGAIISIFNLFDQFGAPSMTSVFKREVVV